MKIQCDVCSKDEASVFCTADEAALCDTCDHRVHHANKLASKHQRFSLLHPPPKNFPLCDVCQEKRAFLFCQQDRAILCRDCDVPIHKANEHTQKHNRFLLTGVELSATSTVYMSSSSSVNGCHLVPDSKQSPQEPPPIKKPAAPGSLRKSNLSPISTNNTLPSNSIANKNLSSNTTLNREGENNLLTSEGLGSTSSISEYLMETLPGWHVEDFFLDLPSTPNGFCKVDDGILPFDDADIGITSIITPPPSSENMGFWVPQAYPPQHQHYQRAGGQIGLKETKGTMNMKANNRRWSDDGFTVPQIIPQSIGSKRPSPFW